MKELDISAFRPIELSDIELFKELFNAHPQLHSDYTFTTMVCWQSFMKCYFAEMGDSIIIMTKQPEHIQFRPPIGLNNPELIEQVVKLAIKYGTEPPLGMIDADAKKRLKGLYPNLAFEPDRNYFDYVYSAKDLTDLPGKKYIKIRNMLNRFKRKYDYELEPICDNNVDEVEEFLTRWCLWKDCDKEPLLKYEKNAVLYCIEHYLELHLSGLAIRIDGNIEAASIFEKLNKNTAVIHFEKAIVDFEGLYQTINQEAANLLASEHEFINRESDMGVPGLRLAKEKYQPHHLVEVFHIDKTQMNNIYKV